MVSLSATVSAQVFGDADGDGFTTKMGDCNDDNAKIYPGAYDVPNDGIDQDCDGRDAEQVFYEQISYDEDQDGYTVSEGDCNDHDPSVHPGAYDFPEDGVDQDCDGRDAVQTFYEQTSYDEDQDGYTVSEGDCNDGDRRIHPDAEDIPGDGIDQNCDGYDEPLFTEQYTTSNPIDADNDGYPKVAGDCDDNDRTIHPNAYDFPGNGIDEDCDGEDAVLLREENTVIDSVVQVPDERPVTGNQRTDEEQTDEMTQEEGETLTCPRGYEFRPQSGVGCVQVNCEDISFAHYGYTGDCVCGSSGSIGENRTETNKACYLPADDQRCPNCVYKCITYEQECEPAENDNATDDERKPPVVTTTVNDNKTKVEGKTVPIRFSIKSDDDVVLEYRVKDDYSDWSAWRVLDSDENIMYALTDGKVRNQVFIEYRAPESNTQGHNSSPILFVPDVLKQTAWIMGLIALSSLMAYLVAFDWVSFLDLLNDTREMFKEYKSNK
jgi:hypothetical protein